MLQLIEHIIRISSKRDRTEINSALVDAMQHIFAPSALTVYRCYPCAGCMIIFACAGLESGRQFSHNAYLPERSYCRPIEDHPLLQRCVNERAIVRETPGDGADRLVFPVLRDDKPIYLIDITLPGDFPADRRVLLMGLVEYFGHLISLLEYGEADTLTGLANRKTFDKHLFEVLGKAAADDAQQNLAGPVRRRQSGNNSHWLAVCDIDHFKQINDTWGHLAGDHVLVRFGQLMRESFRFDDQLFRFGGEEFVAVLQPTSQANAQRVFERFREAVERHVFPNAGRVTISIGICHLQPHDTPTATIDRADAALYWAKQNGRNRVACHDALAAAGQLAAKADG